MAAEELAERVRRLNLRWRVPCSRAPCGRHAADRGAPAVGGSAAAAGGWSAAAGKWLRGSPSESGGAESFLPLSVA